MPEFVWNTGFAISLVFSILLSLVIGKKVFKSGVEYSSGRILILGAIVDVVLCCALIVFQGVVELHRAALFSSQSFSQVLVLIIPLAIPCRIIWNYFAIQKRLIAQYSLSPSDNYMFVAAVSSLSKTMRISAPRVLSSDKISIPFVFGLRSNKAILAIPRGWHVFDSEHHQVVLLHELAHIRNHDVGFLAWSSACIQDLRWSLVVLPILIVYCCFLGPVSLVSTMVTYLACSSILYLLLRYVVRKRELLADLTAAMLIESGKVCDAISLPVSYTVGLRADPRQSKYPRLVGRMHRWLVDKALFSKSRRLWKCVLGVFDFFHVLHPARLKRVKAVASKSDPLLQYGWSLGESFCLGVAFGLLGVVVALVGHWLGRTGQILQEGNDVVRLVFQIYGMISPIPLVFLIIFLVLPVWASPMRPALNRKFLLSAVIRYGVPLGGACLVSPLILTLGISTSQSWMLLALCVFWLVFVAAFGFAFNIAAVFLWARIRYFPFSRVAELKKAIWKFGMFIAAVFGLVVIGGVFLRRGMVFYATDVICSTVIGAALITATIRARFSEAEQYIVITMPFVTRRIEGLRFRLWTWILHSFGITALLFLYVSLLFVGIQVVFGTVLRGLDSTAGILLTCAVCCAVLVLLECGIPGRISEAQRRKVCSLCHCLRLLSEPLDSRVSEKIRRVIQSYDLPTERTGTRLLNLVVNDIGQLSVFISEDSTQNERLSLVVEWILECQVDGGFGVWPGSAARLRSTYQALSLLRDSNALDRCRRDSHIQWIKQCQRSDGFFEGPWSRLPAWENTFYAVKSLDVLGASMDLVYAQACLDWCHHNLVHEGVEKDRVDIVFYCCGTLGCLGKISGNILELVSQYLISRTNELLLTNVSLDYENVHFSVMLYQLLKAQVAEIPDMSRMRLLIHGIQNALVAELHDISA